MDQLASVGNFFTQQALPYAGNIAGRGINTVELLNALAGHADALPRFLAEQQQLLQDPAFRQAAGQSPFTAGLVGQGLQQQQPDLNAFAAGLQPGQSGQLPGSRAVPTLPALTPANQLAQNVTGAEAGILQDPATLRRVALAQLGVKPTFAENLQQLVDLGQPVSAGGGFQIKGVNLETGGITLGTRPAPEPDYVPTSIPGVYYDRNTGKPVYPRTSGVDPATQAMIERLFPGLLSGSAAGGGEPTTTVPTPRGPMQVPQSAQDLASAGATPTTTPSTAPPTTTTRPPLPPPPGEGWVPAPGVTPPTGRTGFPSGAPDAPTSPTTTTPQLPPMQPRAAQSPYQARLSIGPKGPTVSVAQPSINQQRARATETTDIANLTQGISAGRVLLSLLEKGSPGEPLIGLKPGQAGTGPLTSKALQTLSTYRGDPILVNLLGEKFNTHPVDVQFQAINSLTSDLNLTRFVLSGKRLTAAELTVFQGALPNPSQPPQVFRARVIGMLNLAERLMAVKTALAETTPEQQQVVEEQLVRGFIADSAAAQGVRLDPQAPATTVPPQALGGQQGPTGATVTPQDANILGTIR